ncbi:MAG TPA: EAL domain-containing protein [Telmatospirillum sp.]|nr:EAL domain-containing protein [Telmatospirillum sp.]
MRFIFKIIVLVVLVLTGGISGTAKDARADGPPHSVTVVLDENLPPFSFRDEKGALQGICKDLWTLWSQRTGIPVRLEARDWRMALQGILSGETDVIDPIIFSQDAAQSLDFSAPYATIDRFVFFDGDATGVSDISSFRTLTMGVETRFRYPPPLYTTHLHWAVAKGNSRLRKVLEDGFTHISAAERREIEARWSKTAQTPLSPVFDPRLALGVVLSVVLCTMVLLIWIFRLRRQAVRNDAAMDFMSHHDSLTGLPNHAVARDHVARWIASPAGSITAMLMLNIDHLKAVNDSLGYPVGDALIKSVALRLRDCLGDGGIVSRQGGGEFLILLNGLRTADAVTIVASRILDALARPFKAGAHDVPVSASIGISLFPDHGADFDSLVRKADMAMHRAKAEGQNVFLMFAEQMGTDGLRHLTIENGLRRALSRGEFLLHYQPQFDVEDGFLDGAEALIRWNDPARGLVPPDEFISIAEQSGLIIPIGDWVLREACRQTAAWQRETGTRWTIAVNISAIQVTRGDLWTSVTEALADSGLDPVLLELELTESILLQDQETTLASLRRLRALGVKFSIDDFGTGYSSLAYLKRFAAEKLKIDQSFIRNLRWESGDAAIVRAILQMAKGLGMRTIAEGIEDPWTLDFLKQHGCDLAQGYLLGRPVTVDQFLRFLVPSQAIQVVRDAG